MEENLPKEQSNCFRDAALRTRLGTELIPVQANMRPAAVGAKLPFIRSLIPLGSDEQSTEPKPACYSAATVSP